jgi:hypothetical protein
VVVVIVVRCVAATWGSREGMEMPPAKRSQRDSIMATVGPSPPLEGMHCQARTGERPPIAQSMAYRGRGRPPSALPKDLGTNQQAFGAAPGRTGHDSTHPPITAAAWAAAWGLGLAGWLASFGSAACLGRGREPGMPDAVCWWSRMQERASRGPGPLGGKGSLCVRMCVPGGGSEVSWEWVGGA